MRFARICSFLLIAAAAMAEVPRPSPDYSFRLLSGQEVKVNDYRGKVIVIAFVSTTCPHCQAATQILSDVQKEYGAKGVQVLGVAFNENVQRLLPDFIQQFKPTFPVGYGTPDSVYSYLQLSFMQRNYVPNMVFIDRKGTIQAQYAGTDPFFRNEKVNIRAKIDEMLKQPAAPAAPAARKAAPGKKT